MTRYAVTKYEERDDGSAGVQTCGIYDNPSMAYEVGYALCKADHDRLGYPPGDMRVIYPTPLVSSESAIQ